MRWRKTRAHPEPVIVRDPLVLSVTEPVTRDTAAGLVARVGRIAANSRIVIDLTAIPDFDSDGAAALVGLQESLGAERVTIVGMRQAAARLVGTDELASTPPGELSTPWVVRRLRAIAVVQTVPEASPTATRAPATTAGMETAIAAAMDETVGIVVVDLRGERLTRHGVQTIAFASSAAALRGQELLVVNVDETTAERLRGAGLSATTYVAPGPIGEAGIT
jgi:anti-anti-sigma regulatory factor